MQISTTDLIKVKTISKKHLEQLRKVFSMSPEWVKFMDTVNKQPAVGRTVGEYVVHGWLAADALAGTRATNEWWLVESNEGLFLISSCQTGHANRRFLFGMNPPQLFAS